jgi:hypothetical protein
MQITLNHDASPLPGTIGRSRPLIQNLGPGNVFMSTDSTVTVTSGFMIPVGAAYEFPTPRSASKGVWLCTDEDGTDVRFVLLG